MSHVADWRKILNDYEENRTALCAQGADRYQLKYLKLNICRIKSFIIASKGLTDVSVFPSFIKNLDRVKAPKSCQNVANTIIDFLKFLVGKFGSDGPSKTKKISPQSVIIVIEDYKRTLNSSTMQWKHTQQMLDFAELPTIEEISEVRSKMIDLAEELLAKGEKREVLSVEDYKMLMKVLVGLLIFINCKRPSSCCNIRLEHWSQACYDEKNKIYLIPLMPSKELIAEE